MNKTPFLSIIVPVFNSQKYLYRCLDSLVYQTFEDIEIIVVNNGSTDDSETIIKKYIEEFPEKVKLITTEHFDRAGHGRNIGIDFANGEYILFVDSDDMLHYKCAEKIYEKVQTGIYDMIIFGHFQVIGDSKIITRSVTVSEPISKKELWISGTTFIWNKCVRRKLLQKIDKMPENISFEDLAYTMIVNSNVNYVGVIKNPLYFFYQIENSETQSALSERNLELVDSFKYGLEHMEKSEINFGVLFARTFLGRIEDKFYYADRYIEALKEVWDYFPKDIPQYKDVYESFGRYVQLPDTPIENNVFVNGFSDGITKDFLHMIEKNAFWNGCNIIIMNAANCNVKENKLVYEAYLQGNYKFVGEYFAIRKIWEMGGVYISDKVIIDAPMNYIRYFPASFSFLNETSFSEFIFAGMKENVVFKSILDTYFEGMYEDDFYSLRKRITNILTAIYDIPLNGKSDMFSYKAAVFSPDVFLIDLKGKLSALNPVLHMTHVDFSCNAKTEGYITAPRESIDLLVELIKKESNDKNRHIREDRDRKRKERDDFRRRLGNITEKSKSYEEDNKRLNKQMEIIIEERKRLSRENDRLSDENQMLFYIRNEHNAKNGQPIILMEKDNFPEIEMMKQRIHEMENSKSWRYTAFLRKILWLFKKN